MFNQEIIKHALSLGLTLSLVTLIGCAKTGNDHSNFHEEDWPVSAVPAEKFSMEILDAKAIQYVAKTRAKTAFYNGRIEKVDNVGKTLTAHQGTVCTLVTTDHYKGQDILNGAHFQVHSVKEEVVETDFRSVLFLLPKQQLGITCLKTGTTPFLIKEVRQGLTGVIALNLSK